MINHKSHLQKGLLVGDAPTHDFVVIYSRSKEFYAVTVKDCRSSNESVKRLQAHLAKVKAGNPFIVGKVKIHDRILKHEFNDWDDVDLFRSKLDHDWIDDIEAQL